MSVIKHLVLYLIPLILFLVGCSSSIKNIVISENGKQHVWLQYQTEKTDGGVRAVPQNYEHPAEFTIDQIEGLLSELRKEEFSLWKWKDPVPLFIEEEWKALSPHLVEAFNKANSDQWVHFAVIGKRPGLFLKYLSFADGICFVKDGKFHIIFSNIDVQLSNDAEINEVDPRARLKIPQVRLHSIPENGIDRPPVIEGDRWLNKSHTNWLMIDIQQAADRLVRIQKEKISKEPKTQTPAMRMKALKELHDQELITDEEFEKKRRVILNEL